MHHLGGSEGMPPREICILGLLRLILVHSEIGIIAGITFIKARQRKSKI